jgi:hypothetical protein
MDSKLTRNFESCYSRKAVASGLWAKAQPNNRNKNEACVALKVEQLPQYRKTKKLSSYVGLHDVACRDDGNDRYNLPVICEVPKLSITVKLSSSVVKYSS